MAVIVSGSEEHFPRQMMAPAWSDRISKPVLYPAS
jgi:hypothetical protein